jgi:hypothetical protein
MAPLPCVEASRVAPACFMASMACDLSCAPEAFQAEALVRLPIVSWRFLDLKACENGNGVRGIDQGILWS